MSVGWRRYGVLQATKQTSNVLKPGRSLLRSDDGLHTKACGAHNFGHAVKARLRPLLVVEGGNCDLKILLLSIYSFNFGFANVK
jgi:hypothetical protein